MARKFLKTMFLANLVLSSFALIAAAGVPDKIVVQGRATTPLTTLTGTATLLPVGLSQPFTTNTDAYGIFQFDLTNLSPEAFAAPDNSLRLEIGTTTINIPFRSVPFALRAAKADALSTEAPAQFITINVTTITAVSVNVTSITVSDIIISSATVDGTMRVGGGVKVGRSIILGPFEGTGADNNIVFANGDGIIKTADPNAGILKIETAADKDIIISPGNNVGLGTATPIIKLDVNGGIRGASITATAGFYGDGSHLEDVSGVSGGPKVYSFRRN